MERTFTFHLVQAARSAGGDKYEAPTGSEKAFVVYFPQEVSRANSPIPVRTIIATFKSE